MSAFATATQQAMATLKGVAGVNVQYVRGNDVVPFSAVPGQSLFEIADGDSGLTQFQSRDYIFDATELAALTPNTPQRGDQIKETVEDLIYTYEVLRPDGNEQPWRYSDQGRTRIRVHTKLKSKVAAS